jgi:DNA-binding phage protein
MGTPAERIADIAASLAAVAEEGDTRQRVKTLKDANDALRSLTADMSVLYQRAMRDFVDEVGGATAAARELNLSRNRIYQITKDKS